MQGDLGILPPLSDKALLIYFADKSSMPAKDLGEALIGMEACLKEAGRAAALDFDSIEVLPLEEGSIKTTFRYVKKHPWAIIVGLDIVANLMNNSFNLIDRFGANSFKSPTAEMLQAISDKRLLKLCQSFEFRKGAQKIAEPINEEYNPSVKIVVGEKSYEITCSNKYQFYVDKESEKIFAELVNGETVAITGEITRINKANNDLGFKYKDRMLSVVPVEEDKNTADFHQFLALNQVLLRGVVVRSSDYEVPKIKVISITDEVTGQTEIFTE